MTSDTGAKDTMLGSKLVFNCLGDNGIAWSRMDSIARQKCNQLAYEACLVAEGRRHPLSSGVVRILTESLQRWQRL